MHVHVTAAALCPAIEQKDRKELRRAIECCRPRLFHELRQLNSNAGVLALGTDVHFALFGETERASEYQGFTLKFDPEKEP
ncbi:hypothetical protein [Caudoviricetes sp.]|nr:hypothetical protein [Caudoviricetes sp.]